MSKKQSNFIVGDSSLVSLGVCLMLLAVGFQNVTLAGQSYALILLIALGLTAAADVCLAVVAWRWRSCGRALAVLLMLPTIFVLADFMRRAPAVFF